MGRNRFRFSTHFTWGMAYLLAILVPETGIEPARLAAGGVSWVGRSMSRARGR